MTILVLQFEGNNLTVKVSCYSSVVMYNIIYVSEILMHSRIVINQQNLSVDKKVLRNFDLIRISFSFPSCHDHATMAARRHSAYA